MGRDLSDSSSDKSSSSQAAPKKSHKIRKSPSREVQPSHSRKITSDEKKNSSQKIAIMTSAPPHTKQGVQQINRKEVCPFLARVFYSINKQNLYLEEGLPQENQLNLHLWLNSTLRQLVDLIRVMVPETRQLKRFQIWRLQWNVDKKCYDKKVMGKLQVNELFQRNGNKSLEGAGFEIGDIIDVAIWYR